MLFVFSQLPSCGDEADNSVLSDAAESAAIEVALNGEGSLKSFDVSLSLAGKSLKLPCRNRQFLYESEKTLYYTGWKPELDKEQGAGIKDNPVMRTYAFASCRDAEHEVLAWFPAEFDNPLKISEQLFSKNYKVNVVPLYLRARVISGTEQIYYACKAFLPTKARAQKQMTCSVIPTPNSNEMAPIDFISNPAFHAAMVSYKNFMLPAVPSNKESFEKVKTSLLAKIPEGSYKGYVNSRVEKCKVDIKSDGESLVIDFNDLSARKSKKVVLKENAILGFSSGTTYHELARVTDKSVGTFFAVEFSPNPNEFVFVRFEKNGGSSAQNVVRIDGGFYCLGLKSAP